MEKVVTLLTVRLLAAMRTVTTRAMAVCDLTAMCLGNYVIPM